MNKGKFFFTAAALVGGVASFIFLTSYRADRNAAIAQSSDEGAQAEKAQTVAVAKAVAIDSLQPRQYAGRLEAIEEVDVVPRITAWIEKIHFKEGDFVKEGDLLFELEDTTHQAAVKKADAGLQQAQAELKNAETNYARAKELLERNAGSQLDFDNAEQRLAQARAAVQLADAALVDAQNTLSYAKIKSPISGQIGKVSVTRGNLVTPQTGKIVDVKSVSPIYLRFAIGESVFNATYGGEKNIRERALIKVCPVGESRDDPAAIAKYREGTIEIIDNKVDPGTNTVMLWASVENEDHRFKPGSYATALLSPRLEKPAVGVLLSAHQTNGAEEFVYVVGAENRVERRVVKLGAISGKYQIVDAGIEPGETIVVEGMNKLQDGALVAPVDFDALDADRASRQAE